MTQNRYSFRVFWSEADKGYVAVCPELPGVSALGESEAEALREAKAAMELYIEDVIESGEQLPEPETAHEYSGQLRARLPKSLHRQAAHMAEVDGISLNQFIVNAVAAKVGAEDAYARMMNELRQHLAERKRENRVLIDSLVWGQDQLNTKTKRTVSRTEITEISTSTNVDYPALLTFGDFGRGNS
jgi:predicted RNase H-like HicB family nuclease